MEISRRGFGAMALSAVAMGTRPLAAAEPIKFATLPALDFMTPMFAQDAGLFTKQGLDVAMQIATAAPVLLPGVVGGSLQFGVSTGAQVAIAHDAGLDVVIAAGVGVITPTRVSTAVVVRPDTTIEKPSDFIGKKVVSPGINGTFHVLFLRYLKANGIDPASVTLLEGGFSQMPDLLRSKQVDAVLAAEPFLTRMLDNGIGKRLDFFKPDRDHIFTSFYIAKRSWTDSHKDEVVKVRAALREANQMMRSDPAAAAAVQAKYLKLPPEVLAKQGLPDTRADVEPEDVQFWADTALQLGLIKQPIDARALMA
ncbi:MAG: transporter substrate-binding protein [Rhodospirillales bacterium]|nr:transporter substrate-binding protein [Rhodospirillales bacterium]